MLQQNNTRNINNPLRPPPIRYHGHDLEDERRDLPQSLLLPFSLKTRIPGRQVLFRHQQVIRVPRRPNTPPSPNITMDATAIEKRPTLSKTATRVDSNLTLRVERWSDQWNDLKRRITPASFPFAGILFIIIIVIAAGAAICGWYGLSTDTIRHQAEPSIPVSASTLTTERPAPPDWMENIRFTSVKNGLSGAYEASGVPFGAAELGVDLAREVLPHTTPSDPTTPAKTDALLLATPILAETMVTKIVTIVTTTDTHVVTTTSIKTVLITPACTTCTSEAVHPSPPTPLPPRTTTTESSSSSNSSSSRSRNSSKDTSYAPTTKTDSTASPPPPSDTPSEYVMTGLMYCSWPGRPNIYTLCPATHTQEPGMLDPTDVPAVASAASRPANPIVRALSWLEATAKFPRYIVSPPSFFAKTEAAATAVSREKAGYEDTQRKLARAAELVRALQHVLAEQQRVLAEQGALLRRCDGIVGELRDGMRKNAGGGEDDDDNCCWRG
ncbi:hypothetical protein F5X99DRAFT_128225 [Biscogniauxia marginata]|nr:hypothetical protein F5X99DRAFT_128225 [Biscogniauxia marginata]